MLHWPLARQLSVTIRLRHRGFAGMTSVASSRSRLTDVQSDNDSEVSPASGPGSPKAQSPRSATSGGEQKAKERILLAALRAKYEVQDTFALEEEITSAKVVANRKAYVPLSVLKNSAERLQHSLEQGWAELEQSSVPKVFSEAEKLISGETSSMTAEMVGAAVLAAPIRHDPIPPRGADRGSGDSPGSLPQGGIVAPGSRAGRCARSRAGLGVASPPQHPSSQRRRRTTRRRRST